MAEMIYNDEGVAVENRYEIVYFGYLFEGDTDGWNFRDADSFEDALSVYHAYPGMITIKDNYYDVSYENDEWS